MKPTFVVAELGSKTWKELRNKGADGALFVAKVMNDQGKVAQYAFMVSGGKLSAAAAHPCLTDMQKTQGVEHFAFINLMKLEETLISHANDTDPDQASRALIVFKQALEMTGVMPKWQQMLLACTIPEVDAHLRKMGVKV